VVIALPANAAQQVCRRTADFVAINVGAAAACPGLVWQVLLLASCMLFRTLSMASGSLFLYKQFKV
jgi:hypothetical protein